MTRCIPLFALVGKRVEPGMSRRAVFLSIGYPPFFKNSVRLDRRMVANADIADDELIWIKNDFNILIVRFENDTVVGVEEP